MIFTLRTAYTTDLTLAQFEVLDELLPKSKTRKGFVSKRLVVNGILYQLKNGCQWRDLLIDFPQWQTVYSWFRRWRLDGTWEEILASLTKMEREKHKKRMFEFIYYGCNNAVSLLRENLLDRLT